MAQAKTRKAAPKKNEGAEKETREAKFIRLAEPRVTKALKTIGLIANLSGSNYAYDQEQVDAMFRVLDKKVAETKAKFAPRSKEEKAKEAFTF